MKSKNTTDLIPTSSMADIAFLLLIFFLVTTTIARDEGLALVLPPDPEDQVPAELHDRNVLNVLVNSADRILIEGEEVIEAGEVERSVREFILNEDKSESLSESPQKAVVSIRTDRNTSYKQFIRVLDEVHEAYYGIYAGRLGISTEDWRNIMSELSDPASRRMYDQARGRQPDGSVLFPMQISIAEPVNTSVTN